jgi:hypothetical protein
MVKLVPGKLMPGELVELRKDLTIAAISRAIGPKVMAMKTPKNSRRTMITIRAPKNPSGSEASGNPYTVPV